MFEWLVQNSWAIWLALVLVFIAIEALTLDLWFATLAGGALAGMFTALAGGPGWLQIVIFALAALILIFGLRPIALRQIRKSTADSLSNIDRLIGQDALVLEPTSRVTGTAKIHGETWTARSEDHGPLSPGTHAVVVRISGATAYLSAAPAFPAGEASGPAAPLSR
ncbi:NfeD family protein [Galactobacter valiniphilus]|uniref:NfeD family protein n=1 Tax=Galactobacter valiniphilus TaxID=2676122 RepID=A0A399JAE1_9MICC|nr:NfeD family protein [Galactobacter valiniphilus]RII42184.1 NfeD family protein [Galactobacter valiniphilus]